MQNEGYWLNSTTGAFCEIDEHARWLLDPDHAARIDLSPEVFRQIRDLRWDKDRIEILIPAMQSGMIRVRRNGNSISIEFTVNVDEVLEPILRFLVASSLAGDLSVLKLCNPRDRAMLTTPYAKFRQSVMDEPSILVAEMAEAEGTASLNYSPERVERAIRTAAQAETEQG